MSGGYFDFEQAGIMRIADDIDDFLSGKVDYKPETIARLREAERTLRRAHAMAQRVDWLLSGDDGEGRFHERWEQEGLGPALAVFCAYDKDEADLYAHALGYKIALDDIGQEMRSIDKYSLDDYKDTGELIHHLREKYYELLAAYHLPED